jgi:hypothetical protein
MENFDIHSIKKTDSKDINLTLGDPKIKQDQKIIVNHKKVQASKKLGGKLLKETESAEKREGTATFREVRELPWFINVTQFIYDFEYFGCSSLFLSPIKAESQQV